MAGAAGDVASKNGGDDGRVVAADRGGWGCWAGEYGGAGREEDGDGVADLEDKAE